MLLEKPNFIFFFILIIFGISSCSTVPSGKYVKLHKDVTSKTLAKKFNTTTWAISNQNKNKSSFKKGDWVFIPKSWGVANKSMSKVSMHKYFATGELLWPVPSSTRVSSSFGKRWGKHHEGVDIPARMGTYVIAADSGKVIFAGRIGGYGKVLVLGHINGLFTVYAHSKTIYVSKGETVTRGQVISKVGMTGRSTGPHLHFEVRYDSKAINPMQFFAKR